jgi:hypothetical protein
MGEREQYQDWNDQQWLDDCRQQLPQDDVPSLEPQEIMIPSDDLDSWVNGKRKSYNSYTDKYCAQTAIYIKKHSKDSSTKITQWNVDCKKTIYSKPSDGSREWRKSDDRVKMDHYDQYGEPTDVVVIIHPEHLIMPPGSEQPRHPQPEAAQRRTFTSQSRRANDQRTANLCMSDRKMWSNLSGQKLNKEQTCGALAGARH